MLRSLLRSSLHAFAFDSAGLHGAVALQPCALLAKLLWMTCTLAMAGICTLPLVDRPLWCRACCCALHKDLLLASTL